MKRPEVPASPGAGIFNERRVDEEKRTFTLECTIQAGSTKRRWENKPKQLFDMIVGSSSPETHCQATKKQQPTHSNCASNASDKLILLISVWKSLNQRLWIKVAGSKS
jgi:hypothetical protein